MNYIFFNYGKTPKYLNYSINSVLSFEKDARIIFCSDQTTGIKGIELVNLNRSKELLAKKNQILTIFSNFNYDNNPLWFTSLLRVYALNYVSKYLNLDCFTHFDNDVLVYKNIESIKQDSCFDEKSINITQSDANHLVFGFSYFPNLELVQNLCDIFDEILNNYNFYSSDYARGKNLNEMRMLKIADLLNPKLFHILDSLPYDKNKYIFDPSSYGQYFNGTHLKRGNYYFKRRYISTNHIIGKEIKSKRIKPVFASKKPSVNFDNKEYDLVNLHVHSKNLHKFLSKGHKQIIKL